VTDDEDQPSGEPSLGAPPSGLGERGGEILADAAALVAERDEYLLALQRLQADFENYRKRVVRQQEEQAGRAAQDLVGKVLPVLDTLDLARAHLGGEVGTSDEGRALEQARSQLLDVLSKEGLERVDETEVAFDPVVHDAVAHSPAEATDGAIDVADDGGAGAHDVTVDEVLRAGYRWRGQVLRPAMVRVRG
jgi:molecular chaperone GrpE